MDKEEDVDHSLHFELLQNTTEDTECPCTTNWSTARGEEREDVNNSSSEREGEKKRKVIPVVEDNGTSSVLMLGLLQDSNEVNDSCTVGWSCVLCPLCVLVVLQHPTLIHLQGEIVSLLYSTIMSTSILGVSVYSMYVANGICVCERQRERALERPWCLPWCW